MDSETCVQALRSITEQIQASVDNTGITELCERYKQVKNGVIQQENPYLNVVFSNSKN